MEPVEQEWKRLQGREEKMKSEEKNTPKNTVMTQLCDIKIPRKQMLQLLSTDAALIKPKNRGAVRHKVAQKVQ